MGFILDFLDFFEYFFLNLLIFHVINTMKFSADGIGFLLNKLTSQHHRAGGRAVHADR